MSLLESITLVLGIIGSFTGIIGLYISLSNFFNKRPKIETAYREIANGHDQRLFIKFICLDDTRIDSIYLINTSTKKKNKIYPENEKSKVYYKSGEHNLIIDVQQTFDESVRYKLSVATNYDKILFPNKFISRHIFLQATIHSVTSGNADLQIDKSTTLPQEQV